MSTEASPVDDAWLLSTEECALVAKKQPVNQLGYAVLLTFFREHGRFPRDEAEVDARGIDAISQQLRLPHADNSAVFLTERTAERLRAEIRLRFGFREATVDDADALTLWLRDHVAAEAGGAVAPIIERLETRCRELSIVPPTVDDEDVPLDGVVRGLWREAVMEKDAAGRDRVNRVTYEIAVLETLRERLRCKEIWVVGADRYRNPDEDQPGDFYQNREEYHRALNLPLDADQFITGLQGEMRDALATLDAGLPDNPLVRLSGRKGGWITLTPLDAQPAPPNLAKLKSELNAL